jgi:hypothetical protein
MGGQIQVMRASVETLGEKLHRQASWQAPYVVLPIALALGVLGRWGRPSGLSPRTERMRAACHIRKSLHKRHGESGQEMEGYFSQEIR